MRAGEKTTSTLAYLILSKNNRNHNQTKQESMVFKSGPLYNQKIEGFKIFKVGPRSNYDDIITNLIII